MRPKSPTRKTIQRLQEYSIPLLVGVSVAVLAANYSAATYHELIHTPLHRILTIEAPTARGGSHAEGSHDQHLHVTLAHSGSGAEHHVSDSHAHSEHHGHGADWEHFFTLHFLVNDIFMVLFFGLAAKEIAEACLPGGSLNPVSKAINPLLGTLGGVLGPVGVFLALNYCIGETSWARGWGIPTATDIALAWLVARFVFGPGHAAISFLLLLAVADDAIGLGIIAIAYPDPQHPTVWSNAIWILPGMGAAYLFRRFHVQNWVPYIAVGGAFSWWGLYSAHLHPALALVFIVPFIPGPRRDLGMFVEDSDDPTGETDQIVSPLEQFEHDLKLLVDFGLFFFAFANAGVAFAEVTGLTWIVLLSLIVGKTLGITLFSYAGVLCGLPLPEGMQLRHLVLTGVIAGIGLTVALFVSGQAFVDPSLQGAAKMGALTSIIAAPLAYLLGVTFGVTRGSNWLSWQVFTWWRSSARSPS